jgi:hypothetical protein
VLTTRQPEIKYQVLRIVSRIPIKTSSNNYLIPVRIHKGASPSIYDPSQIEDPESVGLKLVVGTRIFFNGPVVIDPGIDCLLITAE